MSKSAQNSQQTSQIIRQQMLKIINLQLLIMSKSSSFPYIDLQAITTTIESAQNSQNYKLGFKFSKSDIQRAFLLSQQDKINDEIHKVQFKED